jgi:hypothetical protein
VKTSSDDYCVNCGLNSGGRSDSGASILAGAIPGPGAVALLGIGGAIVGRGRRRIC